MLFDLESQEFKDYIEELTKQGKPLRHSYYHESVERMEEMGIHMTGDDPKELLRKKRPNESQEARDYRLDVYKPKTKASASKVVSVINRIYNDRLFSIEYKDDLEKDTLEEYLTEDMPGYTSLMNYIKSVFTKLHMKDPNGVLIVEPFDYNQVDTELHEPIPIFYTSDQVLDFQTDEFFVIGFKKKESNYSEFINELRLYDKEKVLILKRKKVNDPFDVVLEYIHGFDVVPAFRVGGVVCEPKHPILYESYISGVLPHWDDAVSMFSDLQAVIVNHLYPEKWEFQVKCTNDSCRKGKIYRQDVNDTEVEIDCPSCHGSGYITTKGPFDVYQVNRNALNPDAPLQIPPFGYGDKNLEPVIKLEEYAEKEIDKGFEAINMDIVKRTGENQSGIAKMYDRQDLDSFLSVYASQMFKYVIPNIIYFTILWRYYKVLGESKDRVSEYFPAIKEPTSFDVYSINMLTEEFSNMKQSGVSGAFLMGLEEDMIEKRFTDQKTQKFFKTILKVDPISALSDDQILALGGSIDRIDLYVHAYARDLVEELMEQDEDFLNLELSEKKQKVRELARSRQPQVIPDEQGAG